jgi:hypothetical protein
VARRNAGLSGNELAAAVGVTANRRADWARKGLLRRISPYGPLDAVDLACLGALVNKVGPKSAKRCWPAVREAMRDRLPNRRAQLWAVIEERPGAVQLVRSPSAVAAAAANTGGSVSVLAIHEIADRALDAYREAAPDEDSQSSAPVHDLASRRRASASS